MPPLFFLLNRRGADAVLPENSAEGIVPGAPMARRLDSAHDARASDADLTAVIFSMLLWIALGSPSATLAQRTRSAAVTLSVEDHKINVRKKNRVLARHSRERV